MSILIPGMEMPTQQTTLTIFPNGYVAIYDAKDSFVGETRCIPVQPHGRLIDADALMENAQYKGTHDIVTAWDIVDAPTIIPADHIGGVNEMVADKEGE